MARARRRWRRLVGVLAAAAVVLGACSDSGDGDGDDADRGADPSEVLTPTGITEDQLAGVDDCDGLHEAVLAWLDAAAARAVELVGDLDAGSDGGGDGEPPVLELLVESVMSGSGPIEGLEAFDGLFPAAPYGGIAGSAASQRYEDLGCQPADEFPALLAWFGLPADTPTVIEEGSALGDAIRQRMAEDGAGGFVALGLGRRLGEGAALPDSPLMVALADVGRAQEAYRADAGTYADDLVLLKPYLDDPTLADDGRIDLVILVTAADADAYCVHGAAGSSAVVESHDGVPRDRVPGTPSCPNTFPDIDEQPAEP